MRFATSRLQLVLVLLLLPTSSLGNDAAAETAAGGIRLREERRVAMKRERLTIAKIKSEPTERGGLGDRYHVTVEYLSLCWDGPIDRVSKTRFRAAKKDFVPGEDLTVYFLDVSVP